MKVDRSITPAVLPNASRAQGTAAARPRTTESSSEAVQLSAASAQLTSEAGEAPFNAARVQEIKQAISEGRFQINTGAIADRLINTAREMINSQRQA